MIYLEDFSTTKQSTAMTVATTTAIVTHSLMPTPLPVVKDGNCYEKLKLLNTKSFMKKILRHDTTSDISIYL